MCRFRLLSDKVENRPVLIGKTCRARHPSAETANKEIDANEREVIAKDCRFSRKGLKNAIGHLYGVQLWLRTSAL